MKSLIQQTNLKRQVRKAIKERRLQFNQQKARRKSEDSRKKQPQKREKSDFSQTPLGHFLIHECPAEWKILQDAKRNLAIRKYDPDIIRSMALKSDNPMFRTKEFHDALRDWELYGARTPNKVKFDLDAEIAFIRRVQSVNDEEVEVELLLF